MDGLVRGPDFVDTAGCKSGSYRAGAVLWAFGNGLKKRKRGDKREGV